MNQLVKGAYKKMNQPHISYVIVRPQLTYDFVTWASSLWNQVTYVFEVLHFIRSVGLIRG
jgi:hypothetical protein